MMPIRAASPIRSIEVDDGEGTISVYKFGLTWGAWAKLSDALGCVSIDELQKELEKPPSQKLVDALLLATALPPINTKEDLDAFTSSVTPGDVIKLFSEIMRAASPPEGVGTSAAGPTPPNRAQRRARKP